MAENTIQETNAIKAVLRNEITWLIFIVGTVVGTIYGIVIPLNTVQVQLAQVQISLADVQQIKQDH